MDLRLALGLWSVVVLASGCGESPPEFLDKLVPATGKVTLDGKPLEGADITFHPASEDGRQAIGVSGPDGRFEMTTVPMGENVDPDPFKGVVPGEYRVSILKYEMPDGSAPPPDQGPQSAGAVEVLPQRYASGDEISATVTEKGGEFQFELTSKP